MCDRCEAACFAYAFGVPMITQQNGCPVREQHSGIAIPALMRRMARAVFTAGIIVLAVLLLTPGDDLPNVGLWDKLEHGLAFGVVAFSGAGERGEAGGDGVGVAVLLDL